MLIDAQVLVFGEAKDRNKLFLLCDYTDEDVQNLAKETAHKETDVRLWVDHLNHTETRRKYEARRAAEKRRSRKENNNNSNNNNNNNNNSLLSQSCSS